MKRITTGLVLVGLSLFAAAFGAGFAIYLRPAEATRNSSGTYSLATPGVPFQSNQQISSTQVNNTFNDIATEITNSLERNGKGGMLAALRGIDGTVAAPAYSWTSETGSGYYRVGSGDLGLAISGTRVAQWTSNGVRVVNGAVATPSLSFLNDTGGGLYRIGSNDFGFAVNGIKTHEWTSTGETVTGTLGVSGVLTATGGINILAGVGADQSGFKHKRGTAGCTTAAAAGANCTTAVTWTTAFADANYTVTCSGNGAASGVPVIAAIFGKTAAATTITTTAITAVAAQFTTVECVAVHD